MRHTQGPWKMEHNTTLSRPCVRLGKEETWHVAASAISDSHANARLIAAAPELLEALQGLVTRLTTEIPMSPGPFTGPTMDELVATAEAAIKKATA